MSLGLLTAAVPVAAAVVLWPSAGPDPRPEAPPTTPSGAGTDSTQQTSGSPPGTTTTTAPTTSAGTTAEAPARDADEPTEAAPPVAATETEGERDSRADRVEQDAMVPHPRPEPSSLVAREPGERPSETIDLGTLDPNGP